MARIDDLEPKRECNADLSSAFMILSEERRKEAERQEDRKIERENNRMLEDIKNNTIIIKDRVTSIDEALQDFKAVYKRDSKKKCFFDKINLIFNFIKIIIFNN